MFIVKSRFLTPKGFCALTIFPFIIVRDEIVKDNEIIINHEKIHIQQQMELLFFIFFIWYFIEFTILLFKYKNVKYAYRNIVFEKEAYANEKVFVYLSRRKKLSFLRYY